MKVNENVRKEREAILRARREDIRRRKAERERRESAEGIKAEQERIRKEREQQERIRREIEFQESIRKLEEEHKRIERQREAKKERERQKRIKSIKIIIAVICALGSITYISYVLDPVGFVEFFKKVGSVIVLIITGMVVKFVSSMPHYTKPHRYIVQDEINKNYKVEKGWHTTTYVPKDRR